MCVPISSSTLITYSYMCYFWNIVIYHKLMWNILHISFCCLRTGWNGYKELELKIKYYFNSWHCKISFSSIGRFLIHTSIGRFWVEVLAQIFPSTYFFWTNHLLTWNGDYLTRQLVCLKITFPSEKRKLWHVVKYKLKLINFIKYWVGLWNDKDINNQWLKGKHMLL